MERNWEAITTIRAAALLLWALTSLPVDGAPACFTCHTGARILLGLLRSLGVERQYRVRLLRGAWLPWVAGTVRKWFILAFAQSFILLRLAAFDGYVGWCWDDEDDLDDRSL